MLPFTGEQFFSVFDAYNHAMWPAQVVAYALGALVVWGVVARRPWAGRAAGTILGLFWLWNGAAYHLGFFTAINPAAYGFAALFMLQGLLFLAYGAFAGRLWFEGLIDWRGILGVVLIVYAALVYEALSYVSGHGWPSAPLFGIAPCPTTIFTFGVLMLASRPLPVWLLAIPILWAGIGSTAAILLGVPEDLGLLVSGVLGAILLPAYGPGRAHRTAVDA